MGGFRRWALVATCLLIPTYGAISPAAAAGDRLATADSDRLTWDSFQRFYPARARSAHEEGAVGFTITIDRSGSVAGCEVTHSSGHPLLDEETCRLVTLHASFKGEQGLSGSQVRSRAGVIIWKLPNSNAELSPPRPVKAEGLDKTICKKVLRIGTLSDYDRTCLTEREWARQSDDLREPWQELQGRRGSSHGN